MSESSSSKWIMIGVVIGLLIGGLAGFLISPSPDISGYQEQIEQLETQVTTFQDRAQDLEEELENSISIEKYSALELQIAELQAPDLPPKEGEPGSSMFFPANVGTPVTCIFRYWRAHGNVSAQITIKEVIRGTKALSMISDTWGSYDFLKPDEGYEYVAVKIKFKLVSAPTPDVIYEARSSEFDAVSSDGLVYVDAFVGSPEPMYMRDIRVNTYTEGWAIYEVYETDDNTLLIFEDGGVWFKLYE